MILELICKYFMGGVHLLVWVASFYTTPQACETGVLLLNCPQHSFLVIPLVYVIRIMLNP